MGPHDRTSRHKTGSRRLIAGLCAASMAAASMQALGQVTPPAQSATQAPAQPPSAPAAQPTTPPPPSPAPAAPPIAVTGPSDTGFNTYKKMSLDELMNVEVTSVSRTPEKLMETASAIQVITGEDIRRSSAMTLPEALQLAPNLQVAQVNAHDWAITARGFNGAPLSNNALADKLLVMIDGRTVYTPLFGGVFWDVQNVMLEDIDRIEVISGPGGTLWGANAVNGVINVVSKTAKETQGLYVSGATGSDLQDFGAVRYGGSIGPNLYYRVYSQRFDFDSTKYFNGAGAQDLWGDTQSGFRMDYQPTGDDTLTLQGDWYVGEEGDPISTYMSGGNLLGRWTHTFSENADLSLQMYVDDTSRELPISSFGDNMATYDIDFQDRFPLGDRQSIVWGLGYRYMRDRVNNSAALAFNPADRDLELFSGFLQDEITLFPDRLKLTLGSKVEHNDYSGYELEPSARLAWTPTSRQTVWTAVSRAVRSPSRIDADEVTPAVSTPNHQFDSEKVVAYELGYRVRPLDNLTISAATYYNNYSDLRSFNYDSVPSPPLILSNAQKANAWGVELSAEWQATKSWRLRGGYTYLDKDITATSATVVPGSANFEADDPHNQVMVQSMMDLPWNLHLDVTGRYVDMLELPHSPSYLSADARLSWRYKNMEFSVVGQNLVNTEHTEFGVSEIPRSVYGQVTFRY